MCMSAYRCGVDSTSKADFPHFGLFPLTACVKKVKNKEKEVFYM